MLVTWPHGSTDRGLVVWLRLVCSDTRGKVLICVKDEAEGVSCGA